MQTSQRGSLKKARSSCCDAPAARICGRGRVRAAAILVVLLRGLALEDRERAS
jgi:hypothetical protein